MLSDPASRIVAPRLQSPPDHDWSDTTTSTTQRTSLGLHAEAARLVRERKIVFRMIFYAPAHLPLLVDILQLISSCGSLSFFSLL